MHTHLNPEKKNWCCLKTYTITIYWVVIFYLCVANWKVRWKSSLLEKTILLRQTLVRWWNIAPYFNWHFKLFKPRLKLIPMYLSFNTMTIFDMNLIVFFVLYKTNECKIKNMEYMPEHTSALGLPSSYTLGWKISSCVSVELLIH